MCCRSYQASRQWAKVWRGMNTDIVRGGLRLRSIPMSAHWSVKSLRWCLRKTPRRRSRRGIRLCIACRDGYDANIRRSLSGQRNRLPDTALPNAGHDRAANGFQSRFKRMTSTKGQITESHYPDPKTGRRLTAKCKSTAFDPAVNNRGRSRALCNPRRAAPDWPSATFAARELIRSDFPRADITNARSLLVIITTAKRDPRKGFSKLSSNMRAKVRRRQDCRDVPDAAGSL